MNMPVKERLLDLISYLNHGLVERDSTLKAALLAVLAGENLLLVGPPGTAKSLIARKVAECLEHDGSADHAEGYFEYLLTKFSTPEEIFGPLSISELKADRFKRNTAGYLPSVRMAFLDEIFKASSSILNALLTILNERLYHNGAEAQKVPLQALIAASNELPTGQEELDALYDRFLVRSFVDYVSEDNLPRLLDKPGPAPTITPFSAADLDAIRQAAEAVTLPTEVVSAIQKIWAGHKQMFKEDRRENLSDRRLRKVVGLLCISAATNGRKEVDLSDLLLLKDCLWNHPDSALKVRDLILNTLRSYSRRTLHDNTDVFSPNVTATKSTVSNGESGSVVRGFKGSGTEQDPLLIQTVEDIMDIGRPDVGLQGYHLKQTADIDCSSLSSWSDIQFKGHYDGGGHTIKYIPSAKSWPAPDDRSLFSSVLPQSNVKNLKLEHLNLAVLVEDSLIANCLSNFSLITKDATNCTIIACQTGYSLVGGSATDCTFKFCYTDGSLVRKTAANCTISSCKSANFLVWESAKQCNIADCVVVLDMEFNELCVPQDFGGITKSLSQKSFVERCFVSGILDYGPCKTNFYGVSSDTSGDSVIENCALGQFKAKGSAQLCARISSKTGFNPPELKNNASIDSNPGRDDVNGPDGKTIAAALFKQRFFEHTLGWDFKNIWQWNDAENQPELRVVGVDADAEKSQHLNAVSGDKGDLLTQQLTANLWL